MYDPVGGGNWSPAFLIVCPWLVRALLTDLAAQADVPEPEVLARQLYPLYDGSGQSARMDQYVHDPARHGFWWVLAASRCMWCLRAARV